MPQTYTNDIIRKTELKQFELILIAAHRAAELQRGSQPKVKTDATSPPVIALEEIAAGEYTKEHYENRHYNISEDDTDEYFFKKS